MDSPYFPLRGYKNIIYYCMIAVTIFFSIVYLSRGYYRALMLPGGSSDLRGRYNEELYIVKGINPNSVYEWKRGYSTILPIRKDIPLHPRMGGYPPWSYFTGLFLVPVFSWSYTKLFFAILNAVSLGIMARFTYWVAIHYDRLPAICLSTSVLAMGANSFALAQGQYSIIINALIAGMVFCLTANRQIIAGLLYGIALVKPSISAPFFFILLVKRRWLAISAAIVYIVVASLFIWIITGTDPMTMLLQFLDIRRAGGMTAGLIAHPISLLLHLGFTEQKVLLIMGIFGLVCGFGVIWVFREAALIVLLGIASIFGFLWTVHREYDDVMIAFLLIALADFALRDTKPLSGIVFVLVAMSLWLPPIVSNNIILGSIKVVIWVSALIYLLLNEHGLSRGEFVSK